jgi:hypothetical protein
MAFYRYLWKPIQRRNIVEIHPRVIECIKKEYPHLDTESIYDMFARAEKLVRVPDDDMELIYNDPQTVLTPMKYQLVLPYELALFHDVASRIDIPIIDDPDDFICKEYIGEEKK